MPAGSYGGRRAHPLADVFPLLDGPAYQELKERISRNGLIHPVTMYEGMILDGRNRKRACQELGIPAAERQFTGDDPAAYVWDENAARRQLTPSQIAMAAQALETLGWGQRGDYTNAETPAGASAALTREEIARRTGASTTGMDRAKRVRTRGVPEVVAAVESGVLPLTTAERVVAKPKEEQAKIMALPPEEVTRAVRPVATGFRAPDTHPAGAAPEPAVQRPRARTGLKPETALARHMGLPEITFLRGVYRDWKENEGLIAGLDPQELYAFTDRLRQTKADLVKLIHLIEKSVSQENEESK